ncbi:MAG: ABC transporter ATP-binding protein [Gammaproteobacteria bacterium]|nr:ABC transporter ATP-binding protein [Gammaproteobacteria bacterium]
MSLKVQDLSLQIANKKICDKLNINFKKGEFWGIMGINGVGKTTLLQTFIGLSNTHQALTINNGLITLDDINIHDYKRLTMAQKMGMMLQEYEYNFPATVLEATLIGRHPFINNWQWENEQDKILASEALNKVGMKSFYQRSVSTLSGGEKRRLNLATLMTQNPDYYLLDEPVNHLDIKAQLEILTLLENKFQKKQQCGIMIIHDPNLAYRYCSHMLLLFDDGHWLSGKTKAILTKENLSHLYHCPVHQLSDDQHTLFVPLTDHSDEQKTK